MENNTIIEATNEAVEAVEAMEAVAEIEVAPTPWYKSPAKWIGIAAVCAVAYKFVVKPVVKKVKGKIGAAKKAKAVAEEAAVEVVVEEVED